MFIPVTKEEMDDRGWNSLDIILVSGDAYIDSSYNGSAVIGHWLIKHGFRVGMIAQPDIASDDIERLGRPELFWSVSSGCVDSMVANYTATRKFRKEDDFTPGGINDKRPDRACIVYTNLIRKHFKNSMIALGGIEASLRRLAHYDHVTDSVRRSVLFDSKADVITYGMAEMQNLQLAEALRRGEDWRDIRGICYASGEKKNGYLEIPGFEKCRERDAFIESFRIFYENCDPVTAKGMVQAHGERYLIHNPPSHVLDTATLDSIYEMDFEDRVHPYHKKHGNVRAMETIKQSVTTHRGCYGQCSFCAISAHQGRTVVSRSEDSIVREIEKIAKRKGFNGTIYNIGGPTANMYGIECLKKRSGACSDKRCLFPKVCERLPVDHSRQIALLRRISGVEGVRKVFVSSGIRYDMILADRISGKEYLDEIVEGHISGQMKIAPEHISKEVLDLMGKPGRDELLRFKEMFDRSNQDHGKKQFLTYYFMAAHPGCYEKHMIELDGFIHTHLKTNPEQVQIFTPTPCTLSAMMYHTRRDIRNAKDIKAEHSMQMKKKQKDIVMADR